MRQPKHEKVRTMSLQIPSSFKTLAAAIVMALAAGTSFAQKAFPTPDAAAQAFVDALSRSDVEALRTVLGPDWRRFVPAGTVDQEDVYEFLGAWAKQHKVVLEQPEKALLAAGTGDWTQPLHRAQRTQCDAGRARVLRRPEGIRAEGPRRQWRARVRAEVRERPRQA